MKTHEVISIKEAELVAKLKVMPIDELESHAKQIVKDMGSDNYPGLMREIMTAIKEQAPEGNSQFQIIQAIIREFLPNEAYMSDIYARLAAIIMMILSKKFNDTLNKL